jgi:hypothetical protein
MVGALKSVGAHDSNAATVLTWATIVQSILLE